MGRGTEKPRNMYFMRTSPESHRIAKVLKATEFPTWDEEECLGAFLEGSLPDGYGGEG